MRETLLWVLAGLFGTKSVVLVDHDGGRNCRRIWFRNGQPVATRIGSGIRIVTLFDHGRLGNGGYVERWEPLIPQPFWRKTKSGQYPKYHPASSEGVEPMYEYAISDGEGTLLSYGVVGQDDFEFQHEVAFWMGHKNGWVAIPSSATIIIAPCPDDCETGR